MRSPNAESELHKYRGVRKRKWGKWVSEVRLPNSRQRIWLGSYDSAEKAARAFDAAIFCLRSPTSRVAHLNFPDVAPQIPCLGRQLTHQQIRAAAAKHAHFEPPPPVEAAPPAPPSVSETDESSEEVVLRDDWLFSGLEMDELWYDFVGSTMLAATDGAAAEEGCSGFGTSSFLWNF